MGVLVLSGVTALAWTPGRALALSLRPAVAPALRKSRAARVAVIVHVVAAAAFGEPRRPRILKSALPARLADREFRDRPRRLLRFHSRQAGANQRTMQPDFFGGGVSVWNRIRRRRRYGGLYRLRNRLSLGVCH